MATLDLWRSGPTLYPPPDKEVSLEKCNKLARDMNKSRYDIWKDDVDKLLIFAGLFSGVMTGFTTQAYPMLKADPAIAAAQLLVIMAQQQLTVNSTTSGQQQLLPIVSGLQHFTPPPYAIRVNILWFLSLSVSLMTAIAGLLCMQWLHEYQREITGLPALETFAMYQMRRSGLEKWKVPTILHWLSFFLQVALVLFFVGLLDFLWHLNGAKTVAIVISVLCAIAFSLLAIATFSPAVQFLFYPSDHLHTSQCPYKSPQAWAICQFFFHIFRILSFIMPLDPVAMEEHVEPTWMQWRHRFERGKKALEFMSWYEFDKEWYVRRACQCKEQVSGWHSKSHSDFITGLGNIVKMLVPGSDVFYHALQCLGDVASETKREQGPLPGPISSLQSKEIYEEVWKKQVNALLDGQAKDLGQAKDWLDIQSLWHLPVSDPATHVGAEAIKCHLERAIRINNATWTSGPNHDSTLDEKALVQFLPSKISLEHIEKVQVPDDLMYQAFMCISCLMEKASADLNQNLKYYRIDDLFTLLMLALAQRPIKGYSVKGLPGQETDRLMEAMFNTCQAIQQRLKSINLNSQESRLPESETLLCDYIFWVATAFGGLHFNDTVIKQWQKYENYSRVRNLIEELDKVWEKKSIAKSQGWEAVKRKFLAFW